MYLSMGLSVQATARYLSMSLSVQASARCLSMNLSVQVSARCLSIRLSRPDMTSAVDWALKAKYLSICIRLRC